MFGNLLSALNLGSLIEYVENDRELWGDVARIKYLYSDVQK